MRSSRSSFSKGIVTGTLISAAYAVADELTQAAFERTASVSDVAANLIGVFGAGFAVWWLHTAAHSDERSDQQNGDTHAPQHPIAFVGHTVVVSVITLASRVLGLARDAVMAACFGKHKGDMGFVQSDMKSIRWPT